MPDERAAALALDFLGVRHRRAQADGDVVGEVIAADADDRRVPQAAALVDRDVGGAAADIHQRDAELFLVLRQHRLAGGQLLDDRLGHRDAGAVHARDDVLRRALAAGDDVHVDFETRAGHPHRRADAVLLVDDEILRQHVQDFAAGRQRHRLGGVDGAPHVFLRDLPVLPGDGDHAPAVEPLDVRPGQRQMDRVDLDAGHQLRLVDRLLDRLDGRLEVDHDAAADAARLGDAEPDDIQPARVEHLADDRRHFRRADVEAHQVSFFARHYSLRAADLTVCATSPPLALRPNRRLRDVARLARLSAPAGRRCARRTADPRSRCPARVRAASARARRTLKPLEKLVLADVNDRRVAVQNHRRVVGVGHVDLRQLAGHVRPRAHGRDQPRRQFRPGDVGRRSFVAGQRRETVDDRQIEIRRTAARTGR